MKSKRSHLCRLLPAWRASFCSHTVRSDATLLLLSSFQHSQGFEPQQSSITLILRAYTWLSNSAIFGASQVCHLLQSAGRTPIKTPTCVLQC